MGGYVLTTIGPMSPINIGMVVVRPSAALLQAVVSFAQSVNFTNEAGWGGAMFKPYGSKYIGAECGQGFLHTLFFKRTEATRQAFESAGLPNWEGVRAAMVDVCIWNYQNHAYCPKNFNCSMVRVHHK